jgi:hypothetical protein
MEKQEQGGPKNDDRGRSGYIESEHQGSASRAERSRESVVKVDRYIVFGYGIVLGLSHELLVF